MYARLTIQSTGSQFRRRQFPDIASSPRLFALPGEFGCSASYCSVQRRPPPGRLSPVCGRASGQLPTVVIQRRRGHGGADSCRVLSGGRLCRHKGVRRVIIGGRVCNERFCSAGLSRQYSLYWCQRQRTGVVRNR